MFSGKRLFYFLILALVMYGGTYLATYLKPEMVTPMSSRTMSYIDSFFAVFLIGSVGGIILKAHMNVFAEEHKINLAQKEELAKSRDKRNVLFATTERILVLFLNVYSADCHFVFNGCLFFVNERIALFYFALSRQLFAGNIRILGFLQVQKVLF